MRGLWGGSPAGTSESADATPHWMTWTLLAAAAYNVAWGTFVAVFPLDLFRWLGMAPPNYPEIWQCVGMIVGVYGVGYAAAARDPVRHWPIVLVGLLGKLLGPLGFLAAALHGRLPWSFGWINMLNDLIWWIPFTLILVHAARVERRRGDSEASG
jgi:small multidrug resistance pump